VADKTVDMWKVKWPMKQMVGKAVDEEAASVQAVLAGHVKKQTSLEISIGVETVQTRGLPCLEVSSVQVP